MITGPVTIIRSLCIILLLLAGAGIMPDQAEGDDFRCGARIISAGDRKFDVLSKCGEPTSQAGRVEKRIKRDYYRDLFPVREPRESEQFREPRFVEEIVEIDEWVYNLGSTQFIRYLTFENGILVKIETGDYGF